jgi:hypothetical protein
MTQRCKALDDFAIDAVEGAIAHNHKMTLAPALELGQLQ